MGSTPTTIAGYGITDGITSTVGNTNNYIPTFTGDGVLQGELGLQYDGINFTISGNIGVGVIPSYKFSVGSADGSDQIGIYHDNTDAYFSTSDGNFIFQTDEGTDTNTYFDIKGKGTGRGWFRAYNQSNTEFIQLKMYDGLGYIETEGDAPSHLYIQTLAHADVVLFPQATEGKTKKLKIFGYRTGDAKRTLEIGVGVDAADTASFTGVSNYYFNGSMDVTGALILDSLTVSTDATIIGNLIVSGTTFTANVETVLIEDNLMVLNYGEPGSTVTEGLAGIEIDRGSGTNYRFIFDEAQDNFRVGLSGVEQAVATRQDTPIAAGLAFWNASSVRFDTDVNLA